MRKLFAVFSVIIIVALLGTMIMLPRVVSANGSKDSPLPEPTRGFNEPDNDGHGPDRDQGTPDPGEGKPHDNNGCGNDEDRADGNEGWCGGDKPTKTPKPTEVPTQVPTPECTEVPTDEPTAVPTDDEPTVVPTDEPTAVPTDEPTVVPTEQPTEVPTEQPTKVPTEQPTEVPTEQPTEVPTEQPTEVPTEQPTEVPTEQPTEVPTEQPTEVPTEQPTEIPTPMPNVEATSTPEPDDGEKCYLVRGSGDPYVSVITTSAVETSWQEEVEGPEWSLHGEGLFDLTNGGDLIQVHIVQFNQENVFFIQEVFLNGIPVEPGITRWGDNWVLKVRYDDIVRGDVLIVGRAFQLSLCPGQTSLAGTAESPLVPTAR